MSWMSKKGYTIRDILPLALMLGVSIIALSISADVVDNVQNGQVPNSSAYNISGQGLAGMMEFGSWFDTIGLVLAASIVIGVLIYAFAFRN